MKSTVKKILPRNLPDRKKPEPVAVKEVIGVAAAVVKEAIEEIEETEVVEAKEMIEETGVVEAKEMQEMKEEIEKIAARRRKNNFKN